MNIAESTIKYKVFSLVITVLMLVGGFITFNQLGRLEDPEFTIKDALITTEYPGATPLEVEQEVTEVIETAIQQLEQLKEVTSISKPGISIVTATIKDNYDKKKLPQVWDELRRKVNDAQKYLPPGAKTSIVNDDFGDVYGILLSVYGNEYSYRELKQFGDDLKKELLLVKGVAKVIIWGAQQEQIFVEISRAKLSQLGISLNEIYTSLSKQNYVVEAGKVRIDNDYVEIEPTGNISSIKAIENLAIRGGENIIYLKDIAKVKRGYITPPSPSLRYNSNNALAVGVSVVSGGNVVEMGEAVKKCLADYRPNVPLGIQIDPIYFQPDGVITSVNGFVINLIEAVIIVVVILLIFMGLRSGLIIGLSLILTVCATFMLMKLYGVALERISLGALIIALGMLVDNAIVITEGILVRIQKSIPRLQAAKEVVSQSMWPLLGATVIAILAFAAIGLSQDKTGEYTRSLYEVLLMSLGMSWIIGITLTPLFCVLFLKCESPSNDNADPYKGMFYQVYRQFLSICIKFRTLTILIVTGLLCVAILMFKNLEDSFFPASTYPLFLVNYWLPEGTDIRRTSDDLKEIESYIQSQEGVKSISTFIGNGAPRFILVYAPEKANNAYGLLIVSVKDFKLIDNLMENIEKHIKSNYIDSNPKVQKFQLGPGGGYNIEAEFIGDDPNKLRKASDQAKEIMFKDYNTKGIRDDWRKRVNVIKPLIDETRSSRAAISRQDVANALQMNYSGLKVGLYRENDRLIPIMSRAPLDERMNVESISDIQIWSPISSSTIPFKQLLNGIDISWQDNIINRKNKKRMITAQADVVKGNTSVVFNRLKPQIESISLPPDVSLAWAGEYEDSKDAKVSLFKNIPLTILLMILISIGLFNAIRQPLIIWLTVPFAIVGVSIGLFITNESFGFMALLGFLSLSGMLIKNAIVMIDEIDITVAKGQDKLQLLLNAAVSRFRPVMMASITTILGMIPLLTDVFFVGMAITIMSGLLFATILTLIIVPVYYSFFFNIK
ncbi:MAG: efflux RND transporter permease subunit [Candidatus Berkiella sp.]